jgi:type I restriction enzyme S subunit
MTVFRTPLNEFVQFLLQSDWFFNQVSRDIGATINSINNSNLLEYLFAFPTDHEQKQITNQLKSIESLIVGKSTKLSQTQSLKKSLMQDLLTGKVRVTVN